MFNQYSVFVWTVSGLYSCDFEVISEPSLNTSTMTSNVTLRAVSNSLVSDPLVIPYLPSVFLPSTQLHLTDKEPWTMFSVIGIPQVLSHLQVCDETPLLIKLLCLSTMWVCMWFFRLSQVMLFITEIGKYIICIVSINYFTIAGCSLSPESKTSPVFPIQFFKGFTVYKTSFQVLTNRFWYVCVVIVTPTNVWDL